MGKLTEEDKLMRRIEKRFNKGVVQYGLIEDGDKILVGLSGGKDSLALLELLARRSRIYKPRFFSRCCTCRDDEYSLRIGHGLPSFLCRKIWECRSYATKRLSTLLLIPASRHAFSVRGIAVKLFLQ